MSSREFKLKIPFCSQILSTSCGSACIQMTGNFLNPEKFPLTPEWQMEIHNEVRFWEGDEFGELENIAKMLRLVRKNGLKAEYFIEVPNDFSPKPPGINKKLWRKYMESFLKILEEEKKEGLFVSEKCDIEYLFKEVARGHPVICEVKYDEFVTHDIVVRGFKNKMVYIIDPLKGYKKILRQELIEGLDLGYMKNFFSLSFPT